MGLIDGGLESTPVGESGGAARVPRRKEINQFTDGSGIRRNFKFVGPAPNDLANAREV